jgi:hypothetical protein
MQLPVDSPEIPVDEGKVFTPKQFSDGLTMDLTDDEIQKSLKIILETKVKWEGIFRAKIGHGGINVEQAMKLIDQFEDELITRLADSLSLIATVDASPVFEGQPPIIDLVGALPSHYSAKYGADHEKKRSEVVAAKAKGQAFLGIDKIGS